MGMITSHREPSLALSVLCGQMRWSCSPPSDADAHCAEPGSCARAAAGPPPPRGSKLVRVRARVRVRVRARVRVRVRVRVRASARVRVGSGLAWG